MQPRERSVLADVLLIIAAIGAINWGLIGVFDYNLVDAIFGGGTAEQTSPTSRVVYAIVGLCGVATLVMTPMLRVTRAGAPRVPAGAGA